MSELFFCDIKLEAAELINVRLGLHRSAKQGFGPCEKLFYTERFGDLTFPILNAWLRRQAYQCDNFTKIFI